MTESSLRLDVLTGRQVIVAPSRSLRPGAVRQEPPLAAPNGGDPFAEGNELQTPGETLALRRLNTPPNTPEWLVRVVPNQFPAVTDSPEMVSSTRNQLLIQRQAAGMQEVVIETPHPHQRLTDLSVAETARILLAWQHRVRALEKQSFVKSITVFRNEGFSAGASLPHVHSQIVGMETIPLQVAERQHRSRVYRQQHNSSLLFDLCDAERSDGQRLITESDRCIVLCPFAGRVTWQVRIVPARAAPTRFSECPEPTLINIAAHVHAATTAITQATGPVSMNILLIQPPADDHHEHWFLDLAPRSSRIAGFELATDVDIVTVAPEAAAERLRTHFRLDLPTATAVIPDGYHWRDST